MLSHLSAASPAPSSTSAAPSSAPCSLQATRSPPSQARRQTTDRRPENNFRIPNFRTNPPFVAHIPFASFAPSRCPIKYHRPSRPLAESELKTPSTQKQTSHFQYHDNSPLRSPSDPLMFNISQPRCVPPASAAGNKNSPPSKPPRSTKPHPPPSTPQLPIGQRSEVGGQKASAIRLREMDLAE
jgi:hypothetical protein